MRPPTIHWSIENQRNKPLIFCNPISSCVLECICVFSRTYFSGTSVSFNLAALPSSNKHQSLHLQCCYGMGSWDNCGCIEFTILLFYYLRYYLIIFYLPIAFSLATICVSYWQSEHDLTAEFLLWTQHITDRVWSTTLNCPRLCLLL